MRKFKKTIGRKILTTSLVFSLVSIFGASVFAADPNFVNNNDPGMPVFTNAAGNVVVPAEPAPFNASSSRMMDMYQADLAAGGTSYWMDRILTRKGNDPTGTYLMSRGKALYMYTNSATVIGFGNNIAYFDLLNQKGYSIQIPGVTFTQDANKRVQTPSYWSAFYNATGYTLEETKFITDNNVAIDNVTITNTGTTSKTFDLTADSPFAKTASSDGTELSGTFDVRNNLTKVYPRFSGTGMKASNGILTRSITLAPNEKITLKFQMGFITNEIPQSLVDYNRFKDYDANTAYLTQLREYNKWWADNVPYIDVADENIKKIIYYRWWLSRFNFLDANIPGNDYQFPISVEGALGYNNAIVLTQPMHMQDLKYLRSPIYSYGDWVSAGETSRDSLFTDNPGKPSNWNNSYSQYIGDSAFQTYEVHGGQPKILKNLARYSEKDAKGQLDRFDTNKDGVINYDWGSLTGNDADGNAFHYYEKRGNIDQNRTESAFVYGNAMASAKAYQLAGDSAKAAEMFAFADKLKTSFLSIMWDDSSKMFLQKDLLTNTFIPWKEANNYYAFQMDGLVPKDDPKYLESLRYWGDSAEFPVFPFYTANQKDKALSVAAGVGGSNNFANLNASGNIRLFTEVLRKYPNQPYITADMYKKLMYWLGWSTAYQGNINYLDNNEYWYNWNPTTKQIGGRSGIHHNILGNYNYSVIEDIMGLVPRTDATVELWPIDIGWDHFTVNNLRYHGNDVTIVWDKPGDGTTYYPNVQEGYSMYVNGTLVMRTDKLAHLEWNPATGVVSILDGSGAVAAVQNRNTQMKSAMDVDLNTYDRAADLFQKAGVDLTPETGKAVNLALDSTMSASYTHPQTSAANAKTGFTISGNFFTSGAFTANPPIWGSRGSTNAQDWLESDLGSPKTFDDIKIYYYNDKPQSFYREPSMYTVQYYDEATSAWVAIPKQYKSPTLANYNHIQFPEITAQKVRVLMTPKPGSNVGVKELQIFRTGVKAPEVVNTPPVVTVQQDMSAKIPLKAKLLVNMTDDGLPNGTLTTSWSLKSGVQGGQAIFTKDAAGNTIATFNRPGSYVITLTATDGELSTNVDVAVTVDPLPNAVNVALTATPSTSFVSTWENLNAINDGYDPTSSTDKTGGAYGNWNSSPKTQWVEYTWGTPVNISKSDVYWWTDNGGILAPTDSKLQYWNGTQYVDVPNAVGNGVALNKYNTTTFSPITTTKLRMTVTRGTQWTGILEWKVYTTPTTSVKPVKVSTLHDVLPVLPPTVTKVFEDGSTAAASVIWDVVTPSQVATPGSFTVKGTVEGTNIEAEATVYVRVTNEVTINSIPDENISITVGEPLVLPTVIEAFYNDGSIDNINIKVTWDAFDPNLLNQPGTFTILGTVPGSSVQAKANVTVYPRAITSLTTATATTAAGVAPVLPQTVTAVFDNGTTGPVNVVWSITPEQYAAPGTVTLNGTVQGTSIVAHLTLTVTAKAITSIAPVNVTTTPGAAPVLPSVVTATYSDGTTATVNVVWTSIDPAQYAAAGTFSVNGTIAGTAIKAVANVTVLAPQVTSSTLIGPEAVNQAQLFDLTVGVSSLQSSFTTMDVIVKYDPAKLEFDTVTSGNAVSLAESAISNLKDKFKVLGTAVKAQKGEIRVIMASEGANNAISSPGDLLTLHAKTKASVEPGITTVSLTGFKVSYEGSETGVPGASLNIQINVVDKADLITAIAAAQSKYDSAVEGTQVGQYPSGSKATLLAAITQASAVSNNPSSTQAEVAAALNELNAAVTAFNNSVITETDPEPGTVDKSQLADAITAAQSKLDSAVEGDKLGKYQTGSKAVLQAAIASAQAVLDKSSSRQPQVDAATAALNEAVATFATKFITLVPGATKITINDLSIVAKYYGTKSTDTNWNEIEKADIYNHGEIDIQVLAAVARMIIDDWMLEN
ncbi:Ig-like domain-containing protein [Paenibacillus anseongense]|uniref:Ig-like domain-containing protein n=1 Tax=Paenibacillus anseongense TaxID=2682845 RepID=UPI002DBFBCCF|nr:Ig-like domain-containing protein [Paenibacillus anseongense]MEC0268969.1 Ig-like domain-containing protein [Paenibacillus anseongense]